MIAPITAAIGIVVGMRADYLLNGIGFVASTWKAGAIGAVGAPLIVGFLALLFYLLRAPLRLDKERARAIETLRGELTELGNRLDQLQGERDGLRSELAAATLREVGLSDDLAAATARASRAEVAVAYLQEFTSDGLTVRTLGNSDDWRPVIEVKPSGSELPQPLHIKIEAGALLTEVSGQYSDGHSRGLTSELKTTMKGKCAIIELEQPKLQAPGKLTVVVSGTRGEALDIKSIKRQRSP